MITFTNIPEGNLGDVKEIRYKFQLQEEAKVKNYQVHYKSKANKMIDDLDKMSNKLNKTPVIEPTDQNMLKTVGKIIPITQSSVNTIQEFSKIYWLENEGIINLDLECKYIKAKEKEVNNSSGIARIHDNDDIKFPVSIEMIDCSYYLHLKNVRFEIPIYEEEENRFSLFCVYEIGEDDNYDIDLTFTTSNGQQILGKKHRTGYKIKDPSTFAIKFIKNTCRII